MITLDSDKLMRQRLNNLFAYYSPVTVQHLSLFFIFGTRKFASAGVATPAAFIGHLVVSALDRKICTVLI